MIFESVIQGGQRVQIEANEQHRYSERIYSAAEIGIMSITPDVDRWLKVAGYEYHCFISWAHTQNRDMTECARYLKEDIEGSLALSIPQPRVFLDETNLEIGDIWSTALQLALCRSVTMLAICAPIYLGVTQLRFV